MKFDLLVEKYLTEGKFRRVAANMPPDDVLLKAWEAAPYINYLARYYQVNKDVLKSKLQQLGITDFRTGGVSIKDIKLPPLPAYEPTPVPPSSKGAPRSDLGVTDEELIELYKKLRTATAVARELGKPQPTVYRRIKQLGQVIEGPLGRNRGKLGGKTDEELLKMARDLHQNDSIRNMAKRLGIPQPTLYNRLKKLGYISPLHKHSGTRIPSIPISDEDLKSMYNNTGGSVAEITRNLFPGKERMQYVVINKLKELGLIK